MAIGHAVTTNTKVRLIVADHMEGTGRFSTRQHPAGRLGYRMGSNRKRIVACLILRTYCGSEGTVFAGNFSSQAIARGLTKKQKPRQKRG